VPHWARACEHVARSWADAPPYDMASNGMPSTAARAVAKTKRAMMSFSRKGAAPCKSYGEMRERASVPAARRLRSKAFFPHAASALTSARVDLSKYQRPRIASAEMSHGTLFELEAVAQTAQISLAWGITIRQNRGDTTAREPRTYHGRGFSLSASRRPVRSTLRSMPVA
jgi:hypothetical protein